MPTGSCPASYSRGNPRQPRWLDGPTWVSVEAIELRDVLDCLDGQFR
jgi:hypothetical protein